MSSLPLWLFQPSADAGGGALGRARRLSGGRERDTTPVTAPRTARDLLAERNDHELVRDLRASHTAALEAIVLGAFDPLASFVTSYVHSRDAAEDIVQGVFIRLWDDRARLAEDTRLRAYLYSAVRNRALDVLKHERVAARFRETVSSVAESVAPEPEASELDVAEERLVAAVASLTDRQREAVRLRYQAQLTVAEVAGLLGVSIRGTERLLQRAISVLRAAIGDPLS